MKERTFCTYYEAVKAVIPYGAQYKPTVAEDGVTPVLQKQLVRHTENAYKLVGTLPPKPRPTAKQLAAVALLAGGEPVSYTHLDVYKRQGLCCLPERRGCLCQGR